MNYCKDCRYFEKHETDITLSKCISPNTGQNPITGEGSGGFCSVLRNYEHLCGEKGKWFKANEYTNPLPAKKPWYLFW